MITKIIEATNGVANWGKFLVGRMDEQELARKSVVDHESHWGLMRICQWRNDSVLVLDLQTGEGARFTPPGFAAADLNQQHQIWVCPLFEPFLTWLYAQDLTDLSKLPDHVDLPGVEGAIFGYRRNGAAQTAVKDAITAAARNAADGVDRRVTMELKTLRTDPQELLQEARVAADAAIQSLIAAGILGSNALEE